MAGLPSQQCLQNLQRAPGGSLKLIICRYQPVVNVDRYIAVLENNQTAERLELGDSTWIWGRAYVNSLTQSWQGLFPWNGAEWNASRLKSPATFLVMGSTKPANGPGDQLAVSLVLASCATCAAEWSRQNSNGCLQQMKRIPSSIVTVSYC